MPYLILLLTLMTLLCTAWLNFSFVATSWVGYRAQIWPSRHCREGNEVSCLVIQMLREIDLFQVLITHCLIWLFIINKWVYPTKNHTLRFFKKKIQGIQSIKGCTAWNYKTKKKKRTKNMKKKADLERT